MRACEEGMRGMYGRYVVVVKREERSRWEVIAGPRHVPTDGHHDNRHGEAGREEMTRPHLPSPGPD